MPNQDMTGNPIFAKNIVSGTGVGCLNSMGSSTARVNLTADQGYGMATAFDFDASRSSAIYDGSKNQPSALQLLACIRV